MEEYIENIYVTIRDFLLTDTFFSIIKIGLIVFYSFSLIYVILIMTCYTKLFAKHNTEDYEAIIPIWNVNVLLKITNIDFYNILLLFIPIGNLILFAMINSRLAKMYKKDKKFVTGMFFFPSYYFRKLTKDLPKKKEKIKKIETQKNVNPLYDVDSMLTQSQIESLNKEKSKTDSVDNVFKTQEQNIESSPEAYKARKRKKDDTEVVDL